MRIKERLWTYIEDKSIELAHIDVARQVCLVLAPADAARLLIDYVQSEGHRFKLLVKWNRCHRIDEQRGTDAVNCSMHWGKRAVELDSTVMSF